MTATQRPPPVSPAWRLPLSLSMGLAVACGLSACATANAPATTTATNPASVLEIEAARQQAPEENTRTHFQGQISLKLDAWGGEAAKGISLGFFLQGNDQEGELDLMTALGSQMAKVGWQSKQAWLEDSQSRHAYRSLDELCRATLGEPLPLKALLHWMQGRPSPHLPVQTGTEIGLFEQAGWRVDTRDFARHRLQAHRPATADHRAATLKIYLDL